MYKKKHQETEYLTFVFIPQIAFLRIVNISKSSVNILRNQCEGGVQNITKLRGEGRGLECTKIDCISNMLF